MSKDENEPDWLSSENDETIRGKVAPLFGSGEVSLQDPVSAAGDVSKNAKDQFLKEQTTGETKSYGTLTSQDDEEKAMLVETAPSKFVKAAMIDPETLKPHRPGQNACLWLFHFLEGVSVAAALCLLLTQILPFLLVKRSNLAAELGVLSIALRVYISLFCVLFVCTEAGAPVPVLVVRQLSELLQNYGTRGFLYSFVGLICVEEAYSERVKDIVAHVHDSYHIGWASVFMEVSSWLMLSTGVAYVLLAICCCKRLRDRMKQKEIDAWRKYREDIAEWKRKFK